MLLEFTKEERSILAEVDACIDIPRSTRPDVVRKLYANYKRLIAQMRTLSPVLEARGLREPRVTKRQSMAAAVALLKQYKIPAEDLAPRRRLYKDNPGALEDVCLQLRGAAIAREIARTSAPEYRFDGGQAEDPTQSLRTKPNWEEDDEQAPWNADDEDDHIRSSAYHLQCAKFAESDDEANAHFNAADRHSVAASRPDDLLAADHARHASRLARRF
jgi:hypothetical protein